MKPKPDMPAYRSHKIVEAARIKRVELSGNDSGANLELEHPSGRLLDTVFVPNDWLLSRGESAGVFRTHGGGPGNIAVLAGGYYVRYPDGYTSWSPADAFEHGYTAITPMPDAPPQQWPRRALTTHAVNPANEQIGVASLDPPGAGGACHLYEITGFDTSTNPSDPFRARHGRPGLYTTILFQNGPILEAGVNGITHEALLAILIDRLEGFQSGPYACDENGRALSSLRAAQRYLLERTQKRTERGVEGTHEV